MKNKQDLTAWQVTARNGDGRDHADVADDYDVSDAVGTVGTDGDNDEKSEDGAGSAEGGGLECDEGSV
ncbi:hypothetical protein MMC27_005234 [Xylographa pallens]|nr:hypothetical protein [Xylographa pallens]